MSVRTAAILYGRLPAEAAPDEQDVLVEVKTVREALAALGYRPVEVQLDLQLRQAAEQLLRLQPTLVFNLVESLDGSDRLSHLGPTLLEHLGLPFTGCAATAMFSTSNKLLAKSLLRAASLPTAPWAVGLPAQVPPPWIVKSVWDHASIGLSARSVATNAGELDSEWRRRGGPTGLFVEHYIEGREFNLSVLEIDGGPVVLPPAEILFVGYGEGVPRIVDYAAKWESSSSQFNNTPRSFEFPAGDARLLRELRELALRCWRLFECRGYARVDFRVDREGRPWVLEVNANPCLSPDAGFRAAAAQAALSPTKVIEHIVSACLREPPEGP